MRMFLSWKPKYLDMLIIKHYKIPLNVTIRTVSRSAPHSPNAHLRLSHSNPNPLTLPNTADLITEPILALSLELCEVVPQIQQVVPQIKQVVPQIQRDTILPTFPVYLTSELEVQ